MPENRSIAYNEVYSFEDEGTLYEIDAASEEGNQYQDLSSGPEKIGFLKQNGRATPKETGGRVMIQRIGCWRFCNDGQLEYMFRADTDSGSDSLLETQIKSMESVDQKRRFFMENATRIREWPQRIHRKDNLI